MRKFFSFILAIMLLTILLPAAYADDNSSFFSDKTWDEIINNFIADSKIKPDSISLGYLNTVTGEEHYYNPDKYMATASTYKVPLNMYFAEQISLGNMSWDDKISGIKYLDLLKSTIVNSNNDRAAMLWNNIGSYTLFRQKICPYLGIDANTVDYRFLIENIFTVRQMTACIKLLYENPDRFPKIIDYMLEAQPDSYFNYEPHSVPVAHKYGYFRNDRGGHVLNDCGIAYTDDPIVIVMYSDGFADYKNLSDYCELMINYSQYQTSLRHSQVEETIQMKSSLFSQFMNPDCVCAAVYTSNPAAAQSSGLSFGSLLLAAVIMILMIVAIVISARQKGLKIKPLWAIISIVISAAALLACIIASGAGTVYAKASGNPQETVNRFFDSIIAGDYPEAYSCLSNYSSLGLENQPDTEDGLLIYNALKDSYSYELHGNCIEDMLTAQQQVNIQYLDLAAVEKDVQAAINPIISEMVKTRSRSELYDAHNKYLPNVTDEAYSMALAQVLEHASDYYITAGLELELIYSGGQWLIDVNQPLLKALTGGAA